FQYVGSCPRTAEGESFLSSWPASQPLVSNRPTTTQRIARKRVMRAPFMKEKTEGESQQMGPFLRRLYRPRTATTTKIHRFSELFGVRRWNPAFVGFSFSQRGPAARGGRRNQSGVTSPHSKSAGVTPLSLAYGGRLRLREEKNQSGGKAPH